MVIGMGNLVRMSERLKIMEEIGSVDGEEGDNLGLGF